MSELKRKREDVDEGKPDDEAATGTTDIAPSQVENPSSSSSPPPSSSSSSSQSTPPAPEPARPCSTSEEGETEVISFDSVAVASKPSAKKVADERQTILICGKEVVLKSTGGRKRRKHPMETLVILAYKARLALECKANDMVAALEIYREMKDKGVKRDLSTHLLVISLCGGSPGDKDELDPGNGSTSSSAATAAAAAAATAAEKEGAPSGLEKDADGSVARGAERGSAQENAFAAAEAALQIFSEASKGGTVCLPEAAYTSVIRACCLDGRADKAREILGSLKRAGGKARVRTYAPLLEAYAGLDGRLEDCLAVWRDAVSPPTGVMMTEREYLHLIAACTRAKDEKRFLEVMAEYMDDVLQPRSRHSWDVLKAWFQVAGRGAGATAATATTAVAPAPETATAAAAAAAASTDTARKFEDDDVERIPDATADGTPRKCENDDDEKMPDAAHSTATASTAGKCEEEDDEEMTPVPPQRDGGNGDAGCGDADNDNAEKRTREMREADKIAAAAAAQPSKGLEKEGEVVAAPAAPAPVATIAASTPPQKTTTATTPSAEERTPETRETDVTAAAAAEEPPNGLEKEGEVVAAPAAPAAVEGAATPQTTTAKTSNAEERTRETDNIAAAEEPPNVPEKDGAEDATSKAVPPSPVDAKGATPTSSCSVSDGNVDVASPTRPPPPSADGSSKPSCEPRPSGGEGDVWGDWVVSECKVGDDGSCGSCGEVLRSIELSEDDEERLLKQINVLACTNEQRTKQWEGFTSWIERRGKDRFNVIIDGANVGYFKKNAAAAGELADLRQVDWAVKKYEEEGKKPLVVLHSRHLVEKRLSEEAKAIVAKWREAGILQTCAPKNNDDWYWLHAAVYAGGKVLVLTNDEMRDHHFSMLSHRSFQRWKERHQARFCFGEWEGDLREVVTDEPRSYSKRTQKTETSFHLPLEGTEDWLCATRQPLKGAAVNASSTSVSSASSTSQPQPAEQPVRRVDMDVPSKQEGDREQAVRPVGSGAVNAENAMDVSSSSSSQPPEQPVGPLGGEAVNAEEVSSSSDQPVEQPALPV